jgi:hypothetical protein
MGHAGDRDEEYDWVDDEALTEEQVRARLDTLEPVQIVVPPGRHGWTKYLQLDAEPAGPTVEFSSEPSGELVKH